MILSSFSISKSCRLFLIYGISWFVEKYYYNDRILLSIVSKEISDNF